jgi:L-ascorbate metabolism protein UlaG (beta-lactamase superfamily)
MKQLMMLFLGCILVIGCKSDNKETEITKEETPVAQKEKEDPMALPKVHPVSHATAVITWGDQTIYVDPVGGAEAFEGMQEPSLVLITDIHQDHLDLKTLNALELGSKKIVAPEAVKAELPDSLAKNILVMNNGENININGLSIRAIPMYNLREEAKQFHPKGRGNGYVIEKNRKRLYIAGDTEDIPEMRKLKNIDIALIPMNLPYTMPVEAAADAVIEFAPKTVYPYHFRGKDGKSDVDKFKSLVNKADKKIEVVLGNWYPKDSQ